MTYEQAGALADIAEAAGLVAFRWSNTTMTATDTHHVELHVLAPDVVARMEQPQCGERRVMVAASESAGWWKWDVAEPAPQWDAIAQAEWAAWSEQVDQNAETAAA